MPPITVKKKKLTVKTVRAKPDDAAAAEKTDDTPDLPPGAEPVSKATAADPAAAETAAPEAATPAAAPVAAAPVAKPASYVLAGTLAIIAVIMFVALIIIQFMEWDFFKDAFPRQQDPMTAPSSISTPARPATALDPEPLDDFDD